MTAYGDDGALPATAPSYPRNHAGHKPADLHPAPSRQLKRPGQGLSERAFAHARQAAAQAPPLPPGAAERIRQIIYGASPAAAERKTS
jgi:hypothetical protein